MKPKPTAEAFGGVTRLAEAIDAPITTVHSWLTRGRIPAWRQAAIMAAARRKRIKLDASK